jgi:hypothetical protein
MGQVKAPDVPRPKRGLTDFERKIAEILFAETSTNELQVERVLDVAVAISDGLTKDAVDGVVHHFDRDELAAIHYNDPKGVPMCYYVSASGLEAGDKVKLILAKEE